MANNFNPLAVDFLLAQDVSANNIGVAAVLSNAQSFYPPDPASVRLLGLRDLGYGNNSHDVMLATDGKSLSVPGEGNWMVDPTGTITFLSEQGLAGPPTPAVFQFCDVTGNWSNPALVVMDPELSNIGPYLAQLNAAEDDSTFWTGYQNHLSMADSIDNRTFVAVTNLLAIGYRVALDGAAGHNPVVMADYTKAYQAWQDAGGAFDDDPASPPTGTGLVPICAKLVNAALADNTTKFLARYSRLELMARMAAYADPLSDQE